MKGTVFDIQHFSTHDGPGVRTTVFLKGCPLRCLWCHNPESQSGEPQILFHSMRCIGCGNCGGHHYGSADGSTGAKEYVEKCQGRAMELCGREVESQEVIDEVLKDESYYKYSGGGMTLSGGEPAFQPEFAGELLRLAKESGINTAIETSGCGAEKDYLERFRPYTDLFIWDVKLVDEYLYRKYTGGELNHVIRNLERIYGTGADLLLRMILIPEIHLQERILEATSRLLERFPEAQKEVIPYHLLGNSKREKLNLPEIRFREPSQDEIRYFADTVGATVL